MLSKYRYHFAGLVGLLLVGGVAWQVLRPKPPATPECGDAKYVAGFRELLHDNAVHELTPERAAAFPEAIFTLENAERATVAGATTAEGLKAVKRIVNEAAIRAGGQDVVRSCTAQLVLKLDAARTAAVKSLLANPAPLPADVRTTLAESWHASREQLELQVAYAIVTSADKTPYTWEISADEGSVASTRDVVVTIALARP
jgi:hypothetical protein